MRPFVCHAQHKLPRSIGSVSRPVASRVLNCAARTRRAIHHAVCVQTKDPGVEPSYEGSGVDNNLSIFIFVADLERTGSASPRWSTAPSSIPPDVKLFTPQRCGKFREHAMVHIATHQRGFGPHGLQCFPSITGLAGQYMNMDMRYFLTSEGSIMHTDCEILCGEMMAKNQLNF